jgi:hypothetical protein
MKTFYLFQLLFLQSFLLMAQTDSIVPAGIIRVSMNLVDTPATSISASDTIRRSFPKADTIFIYDISEKYSYVVLNTDTTFYFTPGPKERPGKRVIVTSAEYHRYVYDWHRYTECDSCLKVYGDTLGNIRLIHEGDIECFGGVYATFYKNGRLNVYGHYQVVKKPNSSTCQIQTGTWKYYAENGKLQREEKWENGKKNGIWSIYNGDGILEHTEDWKNNAKDGEWKYYDKKGKLVRKQTWKNGKLVK